MAEVAFYHLQRATLEAVLPKLLQKTLDVGKRAVVIAGSDTRVEALAGHLWTYHQDSWLPHGTSQDGNADRQPIWLTALDENPNGATFIFLCDGADSARLESYERCFDLFDGNDDQAVAAARGRWAERKSAGHDLTYWQQTERGTWERKA